MLTHVPRLAWDGAQTLVTGCLSGGDYPWLSSRVRDLIGPDCDDALWSSRLRLVAPASTDLRLSEVAMWRVRLADALVLHPELAEPLRALCDEVNRRVRA